MITQGRRRFIAVSVGAYVVFALAWIFLSDGLLQAIADREALLFLSSSKGVFFVFASAAGFLFALRAVPSKEQAHDEPVLSSLERGVDLGPRRTPSRYVFAVTVTGAKLLVRHALFGEGSDRLMFVFCTLPIILSALMGGGGPGLVSTAIALIGVDVQEMPALHSAAASAHDRFQWALLAVNGLAVSLLSEMLRRSLARREREGQLLDAVVSGTSDAVFVKDAQGRYLLVNHATAAYINLPKEQVLGRVDTELFDAASGQKVMQTDRAIMDAGEVRSLAETVKNQSGQVRVFQVTKGPVFGEDHAVIGLFGISRDVTEHMHMTQQLKSSEERLQLVIDATSDGIWDWDVATGKVYRSPRYLEVVGVRPEDDSGDFDFLRRIVHPEDWEGLSQRISAALATPDGSIEGDFRLAPNGVQVRWMQARGLVVGRGPDGAPLRVVGTLSDITERKIHEQTLREASVVFESSHEAIMMVSPQGRITKVNPAFTRITGYTADEVIGRSPRMLKPSRDGAAFFHEFRHALAQHQLWRGELWSHRKTGEAFAELLSVSVVRDLKGQVQHYIAVFSDISQLKAHEAELDRVANFDPLTGLPNRRLLSDRLSQSLQRSKRSGKSSAVCFLDLDNFKTINDQHGHGVGDRLLVGVSDNLRAVLHADDTLARVGGDEFVIVLSEIVSADDCTRVLDRVLSAARQPVVVDGLRLQVSASIGVTLYPADPVDADTLLRHADQAMYLAKEAGRNHYQLFDPESDRLAQTHRNFVQAMRVALERREFELHYQPKVDLVSGDIVGAEALIRWRHPERGLMAPAEFLPHVQGDELERVFGEWVIDQALTQAAHWIRSGLPLVISVNVSANHFLQPEFFERLRLMLSRHCDVPPGLFELEVLETAAISDMQQAVRVLEHCKQLGVRFALDDFGTGYSSLTYLRKLPVDTLKIDQSFVRDMLSDPDDLGIVEGVVKLAKVFRREVVAEGVETIEHGTLLRRLGCPRAQGYGIARPMPPDQLPAWCDEWRHRMVWKWLESAEVMGSGLGVLPP